MNVLLSLAFDGTAYVGFQVQKNGVSICQKVQDALEAVLGVRPDVKGCSRTDAGVHALDFCLNFFSDGHLAPQKLPAALNANLPPDIRVNRAQAVPDGFHARYAAHEKTYVYRIRCAAVDSPFDARYTYRVPAVPDLVAMQAAAAAFVGTHDFLALCASGSSAAAHGDTVRTITQCEVAQQGPLLTVTVTANGYLYHMVRILAGTVLMAGQHKLLPADIPALLQSHDRGRAGPTLPARGLFLQRVDYGGADFVSAASKPHA